MNDSQGSDLQLALNVHPELDPVAVEVFLSHGRAEDVPLELVHHVRVRHVDEVGERLVEEVARWQNLIPSFPWIALGWRAWGHNPRKGRDQILQRSLADP